MVRGAEHRPVAVVFAAFTPSFSLLRANLLLPVSEMRLQNIEMYNKCPEHVIRVFPHSERNTLNFSNPVGYGKFCFSSQLTDAVR